MNALAHTSSPADTSHTSRLATIGTVAALTLLLGAPAEAQVPKSDSRTYYEDDSLYGFRVKVPKNWEFVPPQPDERTLIGKYDPPTNKMIDIEGGQLFLHCYLAVLDTRPRPESEEDDVVIIRGRNPIRTPEEWVEANMSGRNWRLGDEEELRAKDRDIPARALTFLANSRGGGDGAIHAYCAVYELEPQLNVMLVFNGPGGRKWRDYEKAFEKMAKSFERMEIEEPEHDLDAMAASANPRDRKRARLLDEMRREPGWQLYETENYLVVSSSDDEEFVEELMERVESIRDIFVQDYPPESARRAVPTEGQEDEEDEEEEEEEERSVATTDPFLEAKASVIRVCNNRAQYHSYGGPGGSAGYWSARDEELVIYDDQAGGGRDDTWAVLNHEGFHQYIYYFYGKLAPHSWYNEGTGDFYSGYEYRHKRFRLKPFDWREQTIKNMLREDKYVPLEEITRWTKRQYYSSSDYGTSPGEHYAQGWSFIYFMRTGPEDCRDWNESWDTILDTYLLTLAETGDLDEAVDVAFEGVDWAEMEAAWKAYIL